MGWSSGQAALTVNHMVKVKQLLEDFPKLHPSHVRFHARERGARSIKNCYNCIIMQYRFGEEQQTIASDTCTYVDHVDVPHCQIKYHEIILYCIRYRQLVNHAINHR